MIYMCTECGNLIFDNELPEQKPFHEAKVTMKKCSVYSCNSGEMVYFDGIENVPGVMSMILAIGKSRQFSGLRIDSMPTILKTKGISLKVDMLFKTENIGLISDYMDKATARLRAAPYVTLDEFTFVKGINAAYECTSAGMKFQAHLNKCYQSTAETWDYINGLVEKSLEFLTMVLSSCIDIDNAEDTLNEARIQTRRLLKVFNDTEEEVKEELKSEPEAKPETEKEPEAKPESTVESWNPFARPTPKKEETKEEETEPESVEEWNPFIEKEAKEPEPTPKKKRASRDEIYAALDKGYTKEQVMEEFKVSTKTYNRRKEEWLTKKKNNINEIPEVKAAKVESEMAKPKTSGYEWKKFKREDD